MIKSLEKNLQLALKVTILHLLHDPIIFKEGVQSDRTTWSEGGTPGLMGLYGGFKH